MKKSLLFFITLVLILTLASCSRIPEPQITYAEFPFEVVYKLGGETVTVNDVYICEYEGLEWNEGFGKHRQWKGYVKSSGTKEFILLEEGNLKFAIKVGSPEYYMSDPTLTESTPPTPSIFYIQTFSSGGVSSGTAGIDKMLEERGLELVSYQFSQPIANHYE